MNSITKSFAKIFAAAVVTLVALGMTFSFASAVTTAQLVAAGFSEGEAAIIMQLFGEDDNSSSPSCAVFGLPGVVGVQQAVNQLGYMPSLVADGVAGPKTRAGVMWAQAMLGVGADGAWGPITNSAYVAYITANCGDDIDDEDDDDDDDNSELQGGAGSIEDADWVSSLSNEEVGEDEEDAEVAGLEIEADEGSDLMLTAVRLDFDQGTANNDFDEYATEVSVWFDGEEVARVDADEFDDDNNYDKTLTLDDGAIIDAGETGDLVIAVSGVSNLDSNDTGETWTVEVDQVRFEDGSGAIITDSSTGDIGSTRTFSFETFANSADVELSISEADNDDVNKAHMINLETSGNGSTDGVEVLDFYLEAEGDSDLEIREFGVDFVVTGATNVDDVIKGGSSPAVFLVLDGEEYGTASYNEDGDGVAVGADEEVLFDDVDFTIDAGDKIRGQIVIDILDISDEDNEGNTILAQITSTQTADAALVDVRDETNEQLASGDITGTATGEASQMYDVTFIITSDGWDADAVQSSDTSGIDESVTFHFDFEIEAVDGDVYIDDACTEDTSPASLDTTDSGFNFFATNEADSAIVCSFTTGAETGTGNFLVEEGTTENFSVALTATADVASDFVQVTVEGINWSEADEAGDRMFEGDLDNMYKSDSIYINNR